MTLQKGSLDEIIEQNNKSHRNNGQGMLKKNRFGVNLNFRSQRWLKKNNCHNELISSKKNLIKEIMKGRNCLCPIALIIEGEDLDIFVLRLMLYNLLIPSDSCLTGADAIEKIVNLRQNKCCNYYKLILLNFNLPMKTGLEILDEIKRIYSEEGLTNLNVIAISGFPQESQTVNDALSKGAKWFLMKPISQDVLVLKIEGEWLQ